MKSHKSILIALILTVVLGGIAYAASDPTYFIGVNGTAYYAPKEGDTVKVDETISGTGVCRNVNDVLGDHNVFIPTSNPDHDTNGYEWASFITNVPGSVARLSLCAVSTPGCTDPSARNYNPSATTDDGSCAFSQCFDLNIDAYDNALHAATGGGLPICASGAFGPDYTTSVTEGPWVTREDWIPLIGVCDGYATGAYSGKITSVGSYYPCGPSYGCTDPSARNYKPAATVNDGSCTY